METHIDALPEVMLVKIFSWLRRKDKASCSMVCKYWEAVCNTVSLWKDEEARLQLDTVSSDVLENLGRRRVGRVCVTACRRPGPLKKLFQAHPNMSSLVLRSPDALMSPHLNITGGFCVPLPHLKALTICLRSVASVEDVLDAGSRFFPQVENLTLKGTSKFTCPALDCVGQSFPSLKRVQLSGEISSFSQLSFLSCLPELHRLYVGCSLDDDGVSQPGFCCTSVLHLSISLPREVKEDEMVRLICHCFPSLKKLEPVNRALSYGAIIELTRNLRHLEKVRIAVHTRPFRRGLEERGLGHLLDIPSKSHTQD